MSGQIGLDIDDRCAIESVQPGDSEHVALSFQQFYCGLADWVGPVRGATGQKPDEGTRRVMAGADFQRQRPGGQPVHPVKYNDVGELVQVVQRLRQTGFNLNAGHDFVPVVRWAGWFPDGVSHRADGFDAERGLLAFYFRSPLFSK